MCADYHCSWLRGIGADGDQPFKSGLLFDRRLTQFGHVLVCKQLKPGAAMTRRGGETIRRATRDLEHGGDNLPCLVVDFNDTERVIGIAGPADLQTMVRSKAVDGYIRLGNGTDWFKNIVAEAEQGRVFPGVLS